MKGLNAYIAKKQQQTKEKIFHQNIDEQTVVHMFSRAIREEYGRQGEKNIVPVFYKNGVIFVDIKNSIWAQELWTNRDLFIRILNEQIGNSVIKNIKLST